MPTDEVLQETNNRNTVSTIKRKPLPKENNFDPSFTKRLDNLDLSSIEDSQFDFVSSPTTTLGAISGDEYLGSEAGAEPLENDPSKASKLKTAFEDVRHFAGGMISHPYESTKHFAILRHSHGLVYFQGFSTNIAISVFADQEVPLDRQFWLQKRGFSGKTGLKVGAVMGTKSAWINVTPTVYATADQLVPTDERAWQRDIEKFLRKAPKELRHHIPRETNILRIPCEAEDGYFRLLMCTGEKGKKVICPSPVFRLASTSTSSSSLRGASLSTLPAELGVKIGQLAAKSAVINAVAPLASTVTSSVKQMLPYQPNGLVESVASTAYDISSVPKIHKPSSQYQRLPQMTNDQALAQDHNGPARPYIIGDDSGPTAPFPLRFTSKVIRGSGHSRATLGTPTANLASLPEALRLRLSGVYIGWACIIHSSKKPSLDLEKSPPPSLLSPLWHQALITISPPPNSIAAVVQPKDARVHLFADFGSFDFVSATLSVLLMAPLRALRPFSSVDIESHRVTVAQDIAIAQASLSRRRWTAESALARMDAARAEAQQNLTLTGRAREVKSASQRQVDRVPLHRAGIRTQGLGWRDRMVGNGGVCVRR